MIRTISSADDLDLGDGLLAIDTEFHTEGTYHPKLHLIQVCTRGGDAQLLDPHDDHVMRAIAPKLLERPWLVHAGGHDLPILHRALGGVPDRVVDTQLAAGLVSTRYPAGLAELLSTWCDVKLAKGETLSDWSRRPLKPEQERYAALDVLHLHELWDALWSAAEASGRQQVIERACSAERERAVAGPDIGTLWTRLPGAHGVDPIAASILQELTVWRERRACAVDKPPHSVLHHRVLIDLAKRRPTTEAQLLQGRRAPKKVLRANADDLLAAIGRATRREPFAHVDPIRPGTPLHARWMWLSTFADLQALEHGFAARLVLPPDLVRLLARGGEVELGWRADLVGGPLREALAGERSLRWPSAT